MKEILFIQFLLAILSSLFSRSIQQDSTITIKMKNTTSLRQDDLRCTYFKVDPKRRQYITEFIPRVKKHIAHHMVLYGCRKPAVEVDDWYCGPDGPGICDSELAMSNEKIIYAWAMEADGFRFPSKVGYRFGGDTDVQYLVLQMHYKNKFKDNEQDDSGLELIFTYEQLQYQVGYYILGNYGYIPPSVKNFKMQSGCYFDLPFDIYPIAYRTHGHNLAKIISGYLIRDNEFIEIGRMSPKQPQMFYNMSNLNVKITQEDIIIAQCIMDSSLRDRVTIIGPRNEDEMCNFYIMYYTSYPGNIGNTLCFKDAQKYSWKEALKLEKEPHNADNLDGVKLLKPEMDDME